MQQITCGFLELSKCNSDFLFHGDTWKKEQKKRKIYLKTFLK